MKNRIIPFVLALTMLLSLLAGCSANPAGEEPTPAVCIVLGTHDYFPVVNVNQFYDMVYDTCYNYGYISAVVVSGNSQVVADYRITPPSVSVDSDKRAQIASSNTAAVLKSLSSAVAQDPEVDSLGAITVAEHLLAGKEADRKTLVVVDSLCSTTSLLNFSASNLIEQDPEIIVDQLVAHHALPNLSGVDVQLMGLGQTAGSQPKLTADYAFKLQRIWIAILEATGCQSLNIDPTPLGSTAPEGLPPVSIVPVIENSLSFTCTEEMLPEVIRFDESSIRFLPESAELADPQQAQETLQPVVEALQKAPEVEIVLAGMTASTGGDGIALSQARAEVVRDLLVHEGVRYDQISVIGLGRKGCSLRADDLDSSGRLIEDQAKLNRAVFLLLRDSQAAADLGF